MPFDLAIHTRRRDAIANVMRARGGGVLLVPAAEERLRNADTEYLFRQDSDYLYLTGFEEPSGCALLVVPPGDGAAPKLVMFVRPKDREKEIWTGFRAGVEGAKETFGAAEAYTVAEIEEKLPGYLDRAGPLWYRLGQSREWDERVSRFLRELRARARLGAEAPVEVIDPSRVLHELRLVKSADELAKLRRAAEITAEAHLSAMRDGHEGRREYEVQAEIEYAFRRRGGSGPGYGTIVATGANSCILHYRAGDAVLRDGQLCLVDAGGEYDWYTADVTRTFPVSGEYTKPQRLLYDLVLEAQLAAIDAVRPGATIEAIHDLTVRKLTEGMIRAGLLQGDVDERIADKSFRRFYMHRTSHWLGLDVHDAGAYTVDGKPRPLVPGMVLTVEPGLYVAADETSAPEELRGIGIRIEDDILVTESGHENLTAAVPKDPREVELSCTR